MTKRSLKDMVSDKLAKFIDDKAGAGSNFKMINTRLKNKDFDKKSTYFCVSLFTPEPVRCSR